MANLDPSHCDMGRCCSVLRPPPCRFVQGYVERDPKTHKGYNLHKMSMGALYKEYGLDPMTVDFIGHAIALHRCLGSSP